MTSTADFGKTRRSLILRLAIAKYWEALLGSRDSRMPHKGANL
jgi:hypothetical protein